MPETDPAPPPATSPRRGGRRRDASRDAAILEATIDVLADVGYEGLTMDAVAARAKAGKATLYRRWATKSDLVVAAVASVGDAVDPADLPDTGTVRGDFAAVFVERSPDEGDRIMRATSGLVSVLAAEPGLAEAVDAAVIDQFVETNRVIMRRGVDRGELPPTTDVETIAQVTPLMTAFRLVVQRRPFDVRRVLRIIDVVVMPALLAGVAVDDPPGDRTTR